MKKFDLGIFVNELSHPPKGSWAVIENAISKAYDIKIYDEDYYKLDLNFNHIFGSVKKSFIKLDKSLKYIPIFAVLDDEPQGVWGFKLEYAYLTSKKTDLSFLLYSDSYNMDETIYSVSEQDISRTSSEGKASSVQFVHFNFSDKQIIKFKNLDNEVILGINHSLYNHITKISEYTRKALIQDFA